MDLDNLRMTFFSIERTFLRILSFNLLNLRVLRTEASDLSRPTLSRCINILLL